MEKPEAMNELDFPTPAPKPSLQWKAGKFPVDYPEIGDLLELFFKDRTGRIIKTVRVLFLSKHAWVITNLYSRRNKDGSMAWFTRTITRQKAIRLCQTHDCRAALSLHVELL